MFTIVCPNCSSPMEATDDFAGKRAKCSKCLHVFSVDDARSVPISAPAAAAHDGAKKPSLFQVNAAETGAAERYPLLALYLRVVRIVATILGAGGALVACALMATGIMMAFQAGSKYMAADLFLSELGIAAAASLEFIGALAVIQFVYVVLDIEQNTRTIAQRGAELPSH
jgi:hypothetical protein